MDQPDFLPVPKNQKRVQVLMPLPLPRAYDYAVPDEIDIALGNYVRVELGSRAVTGIVWSLESDPEQASKKIKPVLEKYAVPPLPAAHLAFIDKIARYTMSDAGSVLKMTLNTPDALETQKTQQAYVAPDILPEKLSPSRKKIVDALSDHIPRTSAEIARLTGCSAGVVRAMTQAGQLKSVDAKSSQPPGVIHTVLPRTLHFSLAQEEASESLIAVMKKKKYTTVLLDGLTGSGKTEVYFEAVAEALRQGRQVLVLLPEIALSAQIVERFHRRFGQSPALWHSDVTPAKKRAVWSGVASGETKIVVGARSALFLPYTDLGLIVVDEEHDSSYKQEEGVLYHARDMAVMRAKLGDIPTVLVSATPSLETVVNVNAGKYACLRLPSRHAGAMLPDVHIIDLKKTPPMRGRFLAPPLERALQETFAAGEQSLLFLNRRGYAPLTLCRTCGFRFQCPSCTAWLVEHKKTRCLQCHHCGHAIPVPRACPECKTEDSLAACGPGVERIHEEVQALLPDARTLVLASDAVGDTQAVTEAVRMIEERQIDIIIGTQIVAKGHHFPSLTLVGAVDADLSLGGGDLRAGERTFQLLHQVSGRAGRGSKAGRVFLQTWMPEQAVIRALAANDRDRFLAVEARAREQAGMPPFGKLAALILSCPDEKTLDHFCRHLALCAPRYEDVRVLGPAPAPMAFLRGRYRRRFLIKTGKDVALQKTIDDWLKKIKTPSQVQLKIDIDPQSFY